MARVFHTGSVFRDSVPLRSYVSMSPRFHGAPRRFYGLAGFHNGSVSRDSVPLRSYVSMSPRLHGAPKRFYGQAGFHNGSVSRDSVPLWSYVSLSPRLHGVPRRFYGQSGFHNGSVFRDSVPVWQRTKDVDGSGSTSQRGCHGSCLPHRQRFPRFGAVVAYGREESSSQTQPLCNVQHVTKIYLVYYQRHTFQQFAGPGRFCHQTAIQPHIFTSPACFFFQSI